MLRVSRFLSIILVSLLLVGCGPSKGVATYTVSGRVTLAEDGSGLPGVTIATDHGTTSTHLDGRWSMSDLKGTVTIVPSKTGYNFKPSSQTVNGARSNVDFQASPTGTYSASGYVRDGLGTPLPDVRVEFDRGFTSVTTTHDGKWIKYSLSGTVVATPKKNGWTFNPGNRPVTRATTTADFTGSYTVSGRVADRAGRAADYAKLTFSNSSYSTTADSNGYWTRSGLSGSIVVTASKDGWTFSPSSKTVSEPASDVNFEGTYSAGGLVSDADGSVVSSVKLDFSGGHVSVYTDPYGRWTRDGLYGDVTVTPSLLNWTFDPPSHNITRSSDQYNFTRTYTVSGCVTDQYGAGIADVLLFLGGGFGTARTGSTGFWSASKLSGNVTVTPAKTGLVFTPETVTVSGSSSNLDFVGNPVANAYAVSGRVIDSRDGSGLYKVSFTFSGGFGRTQSDVYGDWSKSGLYGTVTVTPSRPGWTFVPESRVVTGTGSFIDFSGTPTGSSASDGGGRR